ncbi:MAG: ABC transporter ATP-binding protein [Prevotella sp.]|nr:ABC transporter ATP-binding protein [Prevotella sp.]MBR5930044.1 ABC transporter ATP-binding protein [Prevotella sp.]
MITIENLKKSFGETLACNIETFTINDGDILGLVGNNGAGKTTLFRMLLDLLKPDEGQVGLDGINPAVSEEWKASTGAYIDEGFLIDFLTPEEYFAFIGKITDMTQEQVDERLKDFERLSAGEIFGQKKLIRNLSAGNKQKVGIISALFNRPKLVILDEPFNFLDPSSQNVLKHVLTEYNKETGATILVSSHNLAHTIDISTRIALLEKGQIIRDMENEQGSARSELENYFETE